MDYIAHSGNELVPPQSYSTHVLNGLKKIKECIDALERYFSNDDIQKLRNLVSGAYYVHDLGKLCNYSQLILRHEQKGNMPNHVDAGVAYLLRQKDPYKAMIVKSHHWGYSDFQQSRTGHKWMRDAKFLSERCEWIFRRPNPPKNGPMWEYTDLILPELTARQHELVPPIINDMSKEDTALFMRLALSILVESDHFDTALNYKSVVIDKAVSLDPERRLSKLDEYVLDLSKKNFDSIKKEVYDSCRNSNVQDKITYCKSEVGTGKTTSVMAYALKKAIDFKLRRVIYVAPFTNIISQTVDVFREALVFPSEDKLEVVGEHHHQVDFLADLQETDPRALNQDDPETAFKIAMLKKTTMDWNSPIICTTAVQFFETLAGRSTGKVKKLHHLPGSIIIIDESHGSIPVALWPLTLIWLKELVDRWGCHVVFASGSMVTPWTNPIVCDLIKEKLHVPSIIGEEISSKTLEREKTRIQLTYCPAPHRTTETVCDWISKYHGPKVVVCNTISNAAKIANQFKQRFGEDYVLHLSTCLAPVDREATLEKVRDRLKPENKGKDWVLVATSCIEAGVDISFQYGFRENSSLMSAFQLAGRVSRNNEFSGNCGLYVFELDIDYFSNFTGNSEFLLPQQIFRKLYQEKGSDLTPDDCVRAFSLELGNRVASKLTRQVGDKQEKISVEDLLCSEKDLKFETVASYYRVINEKKQTVIIHEDVLTFDSSVTDIVRNSVQVYDDKIRDLPIQKSEKIPKYLVWKGKYDKFLGYQASFV